MKKRHLILATAAFFSTLSFSNIYSATLVTDSGSGGLTYFSETVGYQFTVGPQSLLVTALGFYKDSNSPLYTAPIVGIWNTSGPLTMLASSYIPLNSFNDGSYIWNNLTTPITLDSSTTYTIGACVPNYYGGYMKNGSPTLSGDVSLVGAARNGYQYIFSAPNLISASSQGIVGPNMQYTVIPNPVPTPAVPEPSTYALFALGAIGMLTVMRRKNVA
jgi:hypothetical protein